MRYQHSLHINAIPIMKLIPLLTMAAFAAAVPAPKGCTPGTYSCTADLKGWQVCNVDRTWVVSLSVS